MTRSRVRPATDFATSRARTRTIALDWDGVRARAQTRPPAAHRRRRRRVRDRVVSAGAAYAATDHNRATCTIAGHDETPASTTTTTRPSPRRQRQPPRRPARRREQFPRPALEVRRVRTRLVVANDLVGTITPTTTTLVDEQVATIALTVRNVSDHTVTVTDGGNETIAIQITGPEPDDTMFVRWDFEHHPGEQSLAPGAQRTFNFAFVPFRGFVGPATIAAGLFHGVPRQLFLTPTYYFTGVPTVAVTVAPPGVVPGGPLDAAQGAWNVAMSADASSVRVGDTVVVHAAITNVGDQPQNTRGYSSLAIGCGRVPNFIDDSGPVEASTIQPGETRSFSFVYQPPSWMYDESVDCRVGITFEPDGETGVGPRRNITTDTVRINVLLAPTTTTIAPTTTTSTTTP